VSVGEDATTLLQRLAANPSLAPGIMRSPRTEAERAVTRQIIHAGYAAFNEGDLDRALGGLPEDVEWEFMPEIIDAGTPHGRDAVRQLFEGLLDDFEYHSNIEGYEDDGEHIVMRVHGTFRTRHTGLGMDVVFTQTWDWEDGHLVIRERMIQHETGVEGLRPRAEGRS
jgi:ketosteroid isomerase-like protein